MKLFVPTLFLMILALTFRPLPLQAADSEFETFLGSFDYDLRDEMKIDSKGLVPLLLGNQGILVDIRFPEEVAAWKMGFGLAIPLNELPRRLQELPKDKIIITACPHKDRSSIAMSYLRSKGYEAKYLTDGLIGLAEQLRGERAKDFMAELAKIKTGQKNNHLKTGE
jgi:rhodanese-related sulfurtransferase